MDIPLSVFNSDELRVLDRLMEQVNDERAEDGNFSATTVLDGLKLALRTVEEQEKELMVALRMLREADAKLADAE